MNTKKWALKKTSGEQPKDLCFAVGWYDYPNFFFHGGRNKELSLSDTYFLNTDKLVWRKVYTMDQPLSRFFHACAKTEEKVVYIYGGTNIGRENKLWNDMFRYDYTGLNFNTSDNDKVPGSVWTLVQPAPGLSPGPRKGHSMVYYWDTLILYGGETEKGITDDNFYQFSISTKTWTILKVSGVKPGFRAYHSMDFFKPDSWIIFGGKLKETSSSKEELVSGNLTYLNLNMMDCSNPFIGDIGPTQRFGHKSAYNNLFNKGNREYLHCITGGWDSNYCSMDIYCLKEIELTEDKKWSYEHKNMHMSQKIDGTDEIFETAKRTIIQFKKKLDEATKENIQINKVYSEFFQTLHKYKKNRENETMSSNEKNSKLNQKKDEIDKEKRNWMLKSKELRNYNNLLNSFCLLQREKFKAISEFLIEYWKDMNKIDKVFEKVTQSDNKWLLFSEVDLDSLTVKRRNYKVLLEEYEKLSKEFGLFEKSVYDDIVKLQVSQKEKFKNAYYIIDDKEQLSFKEDVDEEEDFTNNIIG